MSIRKRTCEPSSTALGLQLLGVQRAVAVERRAQQQLPARREHRRERAHEPLIVGHVLDRLQADDLVEQTERRAMVLELAQVERAKVDPRRAHQLGPAARVVLLAAENDAATTSLPQRAA